MDIVRWRQVSHAVRAASLGEEEPELALDAVRKALGFDAALLTLGAGPQGSAHLPVVNVDYPETLVWHLTGPYVAACPGFSFARHEGVAVTIESTPSFRSTPTYCDILKPFGFREGVTLTFDAPFSSRPGMLTMSSCSDRPLPMDERIGLTLLSDGLSRLVEGSTVPGGAGTAPGDVILEVREHQPVRVVSGRLPSRPELSERFIGDIALMARTGAVPGAGFYQRDATGTWWRVRTHRPRLGSAVVVALSRQDPRGLTHRELEVLSLVARGYGNQQIATLLTVSVRTVKTHVEALLRKLGQPSRYGLISLSLTEGLCLPSASVPDGVRDT